MRAKILLVDDDRDILLGLENRITWMGHDPLTASDGAEALRLIEQEAPDLVLLDLELPHRSGLEVLQQIREAGTAVSRADPEAPPPAYTTPLIIILTAFGTIERAVQAMHLGAFDFLTKPFTADHLTVVIQKALGTLALGLGALPQGEAWYRHQIRRHTTTDMSADEIHALGLAEMARSIPVGRLGTADEFGHVVAFLCSQHAAFITGAAVPVDGGADPHLL